MLPILGYVNDKLEANGLIMRVIADELKIEKETIIDFDLYLYDTTSACTVGLNNEFVSSGRLDDLSMVHAGLEAFKADDGQPDATKAQKYSTDAMSAAVFQQICERAGVPCQRFVNRSDVAGGSTLGNILTSSVAIRGVDMGNPVLAMHSVRELASTVDHENCIKAFIEFYK